MHKKNNPDYCNHIRNWYQSQLGSAIAFNAISKGKEEKIGYNAIKQGQKIITKLKPLENKSLLKEIRGEGLLIGIELIQYPLLFKVPIIKKYLATLFSICCIKDIKNPIIVGSTLNNSHTIRIEPSLIITNTETNLLIETIKKNLKKSPLKLIINSFFYIFNSFINKQEN